MSQAPFEYRPMSSHLASHSDHWLLSLSKLVDAAVIASVLFATVLLYRPAWDSKYTIAALMAVGLFGAVGEVAGIYRPWRGETAKRQFFQICFLWIITLFVLLLMAYALKASSQFSRVTIVAWLSCNAARP